MEVMRKLAWHLESRLTELDQARNAGNKVVGYTPGGYLPEELVLGCGAIPLGLIQGGEPSAVESAGAYICRWIDPFCRAQIGYGTNRDDPYYSRIDLLVVPITDNHIRSISDLLSYHTNLAVFPFGVPHKKDTPSLDYYQVKLKRLTERLEQLTGTEVSEQKLREAIDLCNRERRLFREISLKRRGDPARLSGPDFIALHHASFILDKTIMIDLLEKVKEEMDEWTGSTNGPRLMLTGSTLARGDYKVPDLITQAGGRIVIEEFAEGIRPYWQEVSPHQDLVKDLAEAYFWRRVPPGWFRPGRERLDFLIRLAQEYQVDGVVWYQLMFRESYKIESYYFPDILKQQTGLNMLIVESDYDEGETGPLRTRIESFIQSIRR